MRGSVGFSFGRSAARLLPVQLFIFIPEKRIKSY